MAEKMKLFRGVGRRKTSIVNVSVKEGEGKITVNGKTPEEYFKRPNHLIIIKRPLELLGLTEKISVRASCSGGGLSGQAEALMLGIARALCELNPDYRILLAKNKFLTRDPRMVERKKYGQAGARKRFQFSKR